MRKARFGDGFVLFAETEDGLDAEESAWRLAGAEAPYVSGVVFDGRELSVSAPLRIGAPALAVQLASVRWVRIVWIAGAARRAATVTMEDPPLQAFRWAGQRDGDPVVIRGGHVEAAPAVSEDRAIWPAAVMVRCEDDAGTAT